MIWFVPGRPVAAGLWLVGLLIALAACQADAAPMPIAVLPTATVDDPNPLLADRLTATATAVAVGVRAAAAAPIATVPPKPTVGRRVRPATPTIGPPPAFNRGFRQPDLLADPAGLAKNLDDPKVRILDARPAEAYRAGHLPGAVSLGPQWLADLSGRFGPVLLSADGFAHEMRESGVANDQTVIVYDDDGGLWAARVLWALQSYGVADVRLLEGGYRAWQAAGRPVTTVIAKPAPSRFEARRAEGVTISGRELLAAIPDPNVVVVDVRSPEEIRGKIRLALRSGRIPGAVHRDWRDDLRADGHYFKGAAELDAAYRALGVTPDKTVVVYCQNGVRAAHVYLTLKLLGYPDVRLYDGSWFEWGNQPAWPIATEESPS